MIRLLPFLVFFHLHAAGPITHAYLTDLFFAKYPKYSEEEKNAFMVGTLFPDIRYLGLIQRGETHYPSMTLDEVLSEVSPFTAGVKFHSFVDLTRNQFIKSRRAYKSIGKVSSSRTHTFLKLLEDQILFERQNWDPYILALKSIYAEEFGWTLKRADLRKWHNLLLSVFLNSPKNAIFLLAVVNHTLGRPPKSLVEEWDRNLIPFSNSPKVRCYLEDLIEHFELKLSK